MRAAVLSWGTRGDVQPLLALARQLVAAGTEVVFGAPSYHAAFVRAQGLPFVPLGTPMELPAYRAMMERMHAEPNPRRQNRQLLQQVLLPDLDRLYADCRRAAQGADVVVGHWLQVGAGLAAEALGIPWCSVTLHAAGIECEHSLGEDARAREGYSNWIWGDRLRAFRREQGLREVDTVAHSVYSGALNLVAMSRHLVPGCEHWVPRHRVAGFFYLDEQSGWEPEPTLRSFVERHGPVVLVTLGSSAGARIERTLAVVAEALRAAGRAAVLQSPLLGPGVAQADGSHLLHIGEAPHGWLMRHARCVVHHGSAGTTSAVLRAGVPSLVIGNLFDQPYWGNLLAAQGLAAEPIVSATFDAATVASRIEAALACATACRRFAERVASERGAAGAAATICQWLRSGEPSTWH